MSHVTRCHAPAVTGPHHTLRVSPPCSHLQPPAAPAAVTPTPETAITAIQVTTTTSGLAWLLVDISAMTEAEKHVIL